MTMATAGKLIAGDELVTEQPHATEHSLQSTADVALTRTHDTKLNLVLEWSKH